MSACRPEAGGQVGGARACPKLALRLAQIEPGEVNQAACKAIEAEEGGSHCGPTLRMANAVAEAIEPEFPPMSSEPASGG